MTYMLSMHIKLFMMFPEIDKKLIYHYKIEHSSPSFKMHLDTRMLQ